MEWKERTTIRTIFFLAIYPYTANETSDWMNRDIRNEAENYSKHTHIHIIYLVYGRWAVVIVRSFFRRISCSLTISWNHIICETANNHAKSVCSCVYVTKTKSKCFNSRNSDGELFQFSRCKDIQFVKIISVNSEPKIEYSKNKKKKQMCWDYSYSSAIRLDDKHSPFSQSERQ